MNQAYTNLRIRHIGRAGSVSKRKTANHYDWYTLEENHKLKNILKNKFDLDSGIHKHTNGHRLYIFSSSKDKLLFLIKPYLIDHFFYKFELEK